SCPIHVMCKDCLTYIFGEAAKNETSYPPKCCNEHRRNGIPLHTVELALDTNLARLYEERVAEYIIPVQDRVYCGSPSCSAFLKDTQHCNNCGSGTCRDCRKLITSDGHECSEGKVEVEYNPNFRCKACPNCKSLIQLIKDDEEKPTCNHMSCAVCKFEFCWVCMEDYRFHCSCPVYGDPVYNEQGFTEDGFHRDTGLDAEGY
ncbi:uncharacterized protein K452DRAFT_195300, partial [Aplosporella prunicola CBS 121167]